jgi:spoIIIJ-associated protein
MSSLWFVNDREHDVSDSTTDRSDLDQLDPEPAVAEPGAAPQLDPDAGTDAQSEGPGDAQGDDQGDQADVQTEVESADQDGDQAGEDAEAVPDVERLENEGDIAADYLEELLDIADLDGDLDMDVEGDRAAVSIVGADLRQLVGRNGEVLEALQELTRLAVYRETGERSRLMLDVGGFRADRRARLEKLAAEVVEEVKATGERRALEPMTPFERKVVHDVVAAAGATSESEGQEPRRYVVILPG